MEEVSSKNLSLLTPESIHTSFLIKVVNSYVKYYASDSSHTAKAKRYDLDHFLKFLAKHQARKISELQVSDWTYQSTSAFINSRIEKGEKPATVSRRLATLKHFGRTLNERIPTFVNPAKEVKAPKLQPSRPKSLSEEEIYFLKQAATQNSIDESFIELRNRTILLLLMGTGLRADEIRQLKGAQVDEKYEWLLEVKTKGKQYRNVYINSEVRELLELYIIRRNEQIILKFPMMANQSKSDWDGIPLFISFKNARITEPKSLMLASKSLWRIIYSFGEKARELAQKPLSNLHPHLLRHTFATGLLNSCKDIRLVAQALGHSDVKTTMRYTNRSDEQLADAIEKKLSHEKL